MAVGRGCIAYEGFSAPKALLRATVLASPVEASRVRLCPALALCTGHRPWWVISEGRQLDMVCEMLVGGYCTELKV